MKLLLEIPDKKATAVLEVLNSIPYIKFKSLESEDATLINAKKGKASKPKTKSNKEAFLQEFKQAIEEVNLIKGGKLKGINAKDLLNEL